MRKSAFRQKLRIKIVLLLIGFVLLPAISNAQACTLSITGKVLNNATGEPMAFASIFVKDLNLGTIADEKGNYMLTNLCPGTYTIVCSRVGCSHAEHELVLKSDLTYDFKLEEHSVVLENIVVIGTAIQLQNTQATNEVSGMELSSTKGLPLSESLKRLPGVTTINTGASIAKPVIQGLHSNRILILNNGVRQEGQQWGAEHAPEIDPFVADKVTVVKGASSVRYGSDALGGVILVEPRALPIQKGIGGEINLVGFSNGRTGIASGILQGKLGGKLPLSGRLQGTLKKGGDIHTPVYFLKNTGVEEYNFSWALGLKKEKLDVSTFYSRFYTKLGIFRGSHIGNLTDLLQAIERERPAEDGTFSYTIGRPQQRILHELFKTIINIPTGEIGKLELQLTRQFNRRQEFDAHRAFNELPTEIKEPSIQFEITTYTADLNWRHKPIRHLRGEMGLQLLQQANTTDRGALIPNYENYNGSIFWIERWKKQTSRWEIEAGMRYDYRSLDVGVQGRDTINQSRRFNNISGTLGAIYKFPKLLLIRTNLGTAWRAPHVSELYSDGVHHGSASYEKGDPNLVSERAYNSSLTLEVDDQQRLSASVNLFYNVIENFIFLEPQAQPQLTIRGAFPAFRYKQTNARLTGLDWSFDYEFIPNWSFESRLSLLRAWNRTLQDDLVFMPSDRFQHGLKYTFHSKSETTAFIRLTMVNTLQQNRIPPNTDYAPPPPGYTRFDLESVATVYFGKQPLEIGLSIFNLLNASYREYLNRFRYFTDEMGRNISLRVKIPFGIQ